MAVEFNQLEASAKEKMDKSIAVFKSDLATIRAGRANPQVLDKISVDYYGVSTPINQIGSINVPEPRMLQISVWDASMLKEVEKAIQKSDLGLNPVNDGKTLRLIFPEPTEERRKELVKQVKKMAEEAKIAVRNIRRAANEAVKKLKKDSAITEDDAKRTEEGIQKLTDGKIKELDTLAAEKEKEIMSI